MKKISLLYLLAFVTLNIYSNPLPAKLKHAIIIDTDCAIDDMRALSILLSRPEITIKAILISDGSLPPREGYEKVKALLHEFHCDSIPVACGTALANVNPPWRQFVREVSWGTTTGYQISETGAVSLLSETLSLANEKLTLVCLGALTNVAKLIEKDASLAPKIERIIWYNESIKPLQGFNYECDTSATKRVFESGIRIDVISNLQKDEAIIDASFFALCKQSNTALSRVFVQVFSQPAVFEKLRQQHFKMCDDLVALYLTNPELFDINTLKDNFGIRYNMDYHVASVKEAMDDMIAGKYVQGKGVVFNEFPTNRELFAYDVRQIMDSAIHRYGLEEWKANVMTDEFHGHLGVFSIVGAKMGIRAREIFGVGPDHIEVISYAGNRPPYSCLNDGIQVSTGATLGMGTIRIATDSVQVPSAIFTYKGRSIRLSLKKEYLVKVDADIREGIVKYGLMDDGYWKLIRRNALNYWVEWDRNEIFEVVEL